MSKMRSIVRMMLVLAQLLILNAAQAQQKQGILVSPSWLDLQRKLSDLVILQVDMVKADYDKAHLPGAHYLFPEWLGPNRPDATLNAPDTKTANEWLKKWGVNPVSYVVVCNGSSDPTWAARMFATLESFGLKGRVYYLNGGIAAWRKAGLPVTYAVTAPKRGTFSIFAPQPVFVDKAYTDKARTQEDKLVMDTRDKKFYEGDPGSNPRGGHIPGAVNLPFASTFEADGVLKSEAELTHLFSTVAPDKAKEIVTYCFTGQTASMVYLAGRSLGYTMRIYDGSMQEWSRDAKMPLEK